MSYFGIGQRENYVVLSWPFDLSLLTEALMGREREGKGGGGGRGRTQRDRGLVGPDSRLWGLIHTQSHHDEDPTDQRT